MALIPTDINGEQILAFDGNGDFLTQLAAETIPYYPNITAHDCTGGWLFSGDAVLNADGSQVVCDPVPVWWIKAERVE